MAASYPASVKTFSTKNPGDTINAAHINDLQLEVVAIETELKKTTGSTVDHGGLAGLADNDHPQYILTTSTAWQNYTSTPTGWAEGYTLVFRYATINKICLFELYITGTSNNATTSLTLPFTSANISGFNWSGVCASVSDNGSVLTTAARWAIAANTDSIVFLKDMGNGAFTASGGKVIRAQGFFEVA